MSSQFNFARFISRPLVGPVANIADHQHVLITFSSCRNSQMLCLAIRRWIETPTGTLSLAAIPLAFALFKLLRNPRHLSKVLKTKERVLVLGATSGIGRSIARQYAERGAVVCVVGRRGALVDEVVKECRQARCSLRLGTTDEKNDFLGVTADFADVDDMVRVREVIQSSVCFLLFFFAWLGLTWG
jgi:hypothetical protein